MPKKLIQLFIVANRELEMAGNDTSLLVIAGGIAGQLEDFRS